MTLSYRAAIALGRRHRSGVLLTGEVQGRGIEEVLMWKEADLDAAVYDDVNRVTEEGAENSKKRLPRR